LHDINLYTELMFQEQKSVMLYFIEYLIILLLISLDLFSEPKIKIMAIYEKSVRMLFRDLVKDLGIQKGEIFERERIYTWFKQKYPLIKKGTLDAHLNLFSINAPSRIHHSPHQNGKDDLFYQIDSKRFRLYDPLSDPSPIYTKSLDESRSQDELIETIDELVKEQNEFAYEKDLQNFLAKNLNIIENGLTFYMEDGISGLEFPVGNRAIDILAIDRNKDYVVIELKVSRGYDRVVGQILRYIAWIRKNLAEKNQNVRGIIIAREITEDLILACSETQNIELFEYSLSVSLKKIILE